MTARHVLMAFVVAALLALAWAAWLDRDRDLDAVLPVDPAPIPDGVRAWLVVEARVRHDVLGLGTVVDATPTHAPGGGSGLFVLVRFDTTAEPRWIRPRELDPIVPLDEERLRVIERRRAMLRATFTSEPQSNGEHLGVWPRECGPDGGCFWHGQACGVPNPVTCGDVGFCCGSCPARSGGAS